MKKTWRTLLIVILILAVLAAAFWYFFLYRSGLPASLYVSYGDFCARSGRSSAAAYAYEKALDLTPADAALARKTSDAFADSGNFTKAEYTLVRSISAAPDELDLYLALSAVYVRQDKLLDAERLISACSNDGIKQSLTALRPVAPVIQPDGGYSLEQTQFSLSYSGGTAYYSVTEEYPTTADAPYSDPVTLPYGATTVSAIVVSDSGLVSPLATADFTVGGEIGPVTFQDKSFEAMIRELLHRTGESQILNSELWKIDTLNIPSDVVNLADLSNFLGLKTLVLQNSASTDFSSLASLKLLTSLDVTGSSLRQADWETIGTLTSLKTLIVSGCDLSAIGSFKGLTGLTVLDASNNHLTDLTPLAGMADLQTLNLSGNAVAAITPLAAASKLTALDLTGNAVTSLGALSANTALTTLKIASCQVGDLSPLENKTALTTLDASGNTISDLTPLARCTALTDLKLTGNRVADLTPLTALTALQYLDVSGNQLTSLPQFQDTSALLTLNAARNQLTDIAGAAKLLQLNYLNVDQNKLTSLDAIAAMPMLVQVDAYQNPLADVSALEAHNIIVNYDAGYTLPVETTAETTAETAAETAAEAG